jgi:hypothetical protein
MPIRFRCSYCNQLMGIARRKAGSTVRCPTCHADLVVPAAEDEPVSPPAGSPPAESPGTAAAGPLVFERSDFEAFLDNPARPAAPPPAELPPPPAVPSPYESERLEAPSLVLTPKPKSAPPAGLVLSPTQATWLTVVAILLLALAFGAGLLVGHYWLG